jgi:hypothetical protein
MTQAEQSGRRKAIERAVWELRLAIAHGDGVDSALDHLRLARRADQHARREANRTRRPA